MIDELEKIAAAAIRLPGGRIYTGVTHAAAEVALIEDPDLTGPEKVEMMGAEKEDGFLTTQGRFVDRAEAWQVANRYRQMIAHPYADDPEANKAYYGGDQPTLDSGLVKKYESLTCVGRVLLETQRHKPVPPLSLDMRLAVALMPR